MMDSHGCCPSSFLFLPCTKFFDFGARQYSPALNRWLTIDPLSEQFYGTSPYAICNNNPVNYVDVDGESLLEQLFRF